MGKTCGHLPRLRIGSHQHSQILGLEPPKDRTLAKLCPVFVSQGQQPRDFAGTAGR